MLCKLTYARRSGRDRFEIITPNRVYYLREIKVGESNEWLESINNAIAEFCSDKWKINLHDYLAVVLEVFI